MSYPCHPCQSDGAASWVGVSHLQIFQYEGFSRRFMTCVVVEVFVCQQVNNLQAVLLKASYRVTGDKTRFLFIAPKASAEGACIFSKLVTVERV